MTNPQKITPASIKRKKFVKDILAGKTQTQAYIDNVAEGAITVESAYTEGSRLLSHVKTQEELKEAIKEITPEYVVNRIHELSQNAKGDSNKLRALELLGKVKTISIFDNTTNNTNILNAIGLDEIRDRINKAKIAESSKQVDNSTQAIADDSITKP